MNIQQIGENNISDVRIGGLAIKGIGIDMIEIKRIDMAIKKNNRFINRIFTVREIQYFSDCNWSINTIAGNFAAKEAVMKALGTGLRGFKWTDVEIMRDNMGRPCVLLNNSAKAFAERTGIINISISISHCKDYAVANAFAE